MYNVKITAPLRSEGKSTTWSVPRTTGDFKKLDKQLRLIHTNLPERPFPKSCISEEYHIVERRHSYERYLKLLINRVDLRSSEAFREFIQVNDRVRRINIYAPVMVAKFDAELSFKDFIYLPKRGLLITGMN